MLQEQGQGNTPWEVCQMRATIPEEIRGLFAVLYAQVSPKNIKSQ
jgi:hypothetical protein